MVQSHEHRSVARRWSGKLLGTLAVLSAMALTGTATAVAAPTTTITFDELPTQPVDDLSFNGVTFDFRVGGVDSTDANYNSGGPGNITYVQDPSLEGAGDGTLTLTFDSPTTTLQFGVARSCFCTLTPGTLVQLYGTDGLPSGAPMNVTTAPQGGFSEGQFQYTGGAVSKAEITFPDAAQAPRFAFDNLTFEAGPSPMYPLPPPGSSPAGARGGDPVGGPLPPPVVGRTVNVGPLSGVVFLSVPAGASGARWRFARPQASAAVPGLKGRRFVPLSEARQVPVGSLLDTRRGTVRMTSARGPGGGAQSGDFASGVFQVLQSRKAKARGLTELRLKGASFKRCRQGKGTGASAAGGSRRPIRRLRSNTGGRFRTRGRHSSATVRGTKWLTTDRCDGTLTKVTRGTVAVRDFRRRKTVAVKAGRSYLARAPN